VSTYLPPQERLPVLVQQTKGRQVANHILGG